MESQRIQNIECDRHTHLEVFCGIPHGGTNIRRPCTMDTEVRLHFIHQISKVWRGQLNPVLTGRPREGFGERLIQSNDGMPFSGEMVSHMAPDKSAGTGYENGL